MGSQISATLAFLYTVCWGLKITKLLYFLLPMHMRKPSHAAFLFLFFLHIESSCRFSLKPGRITLLYGGMVLDVVRIVRVFLSSRCIPDHPFLYFYLLFEPLVELSFSFRHAVSLAQWISLSVKRHNSGYVLGVITLLSF